MRIRQLFLSGLLLFAACFYANATHLRAGEITVTRESCTSLTFIITITVYTNTGSEIKFGDGILDFGDGGAPHITPTRDAVKRDDLGTNVGKVVYSIAHTYSGPGRYVISYFEHNRNAGILNMFNSVETPFYLESTVSIDPFLGCDNSPRLLVAPIDKACRGAAWYHNPGAYDPDGDSLSYEFTIPKRDKGVPVNNYRDPNVKEFYDRVGINYGTANEDKNGQPTFTIDSLTGTIVWDAPGAPGEYNIAFVIRQWRKIAGVWVNQGYVVRDMQIIVEDCANKRPELQVPPDICVEAKTKVTAEIFGTDPDHDKVKIEAFSQILNKGVTPPFPFPATVAPDSGILQLTTPPNIAKLTFTWQTECIHVKEQPYQVVFKITDAPPTNKGAKLVQFETWSIKVVGPAPKFKNISVIAGRKAVVEWKPYVCTNATSMQIWRRVDKYTFTPPPCVTGMPSFLGYSLIAVVPLTSSNPPTKYTDANKGKGLAVGGTYCYRLVAVYPLPGGGESYVSKDTCLAPIPATAPIITNVTVDKTHSVAGNITVKWVAPYDVAPPYRYKVWRAEGFTGNLKLTSPHAGFLDNINTFTDAELNTEEIVYNYRVVLYDNVTGAPKDTSAIASAVRLEAKPQFKRIELNWAASVPWSNQSQAYPKHHIYRGPDGATESQMVLIDSINVTSGRFVYIDSGQWNGVPLSETQVYCYRIKTKGTYGNPTKIPEPLYNFSQINCAQPNDKEPPCKQELSIVAIECDKYITSQPCDPKVYTNVVTWNKTPDPICRLDIRSYNIYVANQVGGEFSLYAQNVRDTFYIDDGLPSFARCYKISAVDRAGNESELSDSFCFDNCPNYQLPNVFTPNGDMCNDVFSAYSDRQPIDENGNGRCGSVDLPLLRKQCARFVENVIFTVSNRWGKEVYNYQSGGENSIYIDWDGKDNEGRELAAGVYYYNARVTFTVVDPSKKTRDIRGWVEIVR
jgi:hypothetical protein